MRWLRRLFRSEKGSVMVMGAMSLTAALGMTGLAVEVGNGYAAKVRNQRVADLAALSASIAYSSTQSTQAAAGASTADAQAASQTAARKAASGVVLANGVTTTPTVSFPDTSSVKVKVSTTVPIKLASLITSAASYTVANSAIASVVSVVNTTTASTLTVGGCVNTLNSGSTSISMDGGTSLTATGCAVNSNGTVTLVQGAVVNGSVNAYATSVSGGASFSTTPNKGVSGAANATAAVVHDNAAVQAALCQVNKLTGSTDTYSASTNVNGYTGGNTSCTSPLTLPTTATTSGAADWNLGYVKKGSTAPSMYETADYSCQYSVPAGTYTIGKLTVGGGCSITFANGSTLKFDSIDMSGNGMTIGDGSVTVVNTFGFNSGSTITIGNGAHSFGSLSVTGGRTLVIGSGNFNVTGAITESGGSYIKVGVSTGDNVTIGNDGSGTAINLYYNSSGGNYLCFTVNCAAPTTAIGGFSLNGSVITGGGSTIIFPIATTHVINGNLNLNGNSTFGSGIYILKGNFTNNTGGTMSGKDVTFALGGTFALSGGTSLDLAAATADSNGNSTSGFGIPDVLVVTKATGTMYLGGGTADKYSGMVYAPNAAVSMSGGASLSNSGSKCLMVTSDTFQLTGGAIFSTNACSSIKTGSAATSSTSTSGVVKLIQ